MALSHMFYVDSIMKQSMKIIFTRFLKNIRKLCQIVFKYTFNERKKVIHAVFLKLSQQLLKYKLMMCYDIME